MCQMSLYEFYLTIICRRLRPGWLLMTQGIVGWGAGLGRVHLLDTSL